MLIIFSPLGHLAAQGLDAHGFLAAQAHESPRRKQYQWENDLFEHGFFSP